MTLIRVIKKKVIYYGFFPCDERGSVHIEKDDTWMKLKENNNLVFLFNLRKIDMMRLRKYFKKF